MKFRKQQNQYISNRCICTLLYSNSPTDNSLSILQIYVDKTHFGTLAFSGDATFRSGCSQEHPDLKKKKLNTIIENFLFVYP